MRHLTIKTLLILAGLLIFQTADAAITKPSNNLGLVGYWSFEDATGTVATDFSGYGNTGVFVSDPTWAKGKRGGGLNIDDTNDNLTAGTAPSVSGLTAATWAGWIYNVGNYGAIFYKSDNNGSQGWWVQFTGGAFELRVVHSAANMAATTTNIPAVNQWMHFAITWPGGSTASDVKIYINGTEVALTGTQNGAGSHDSDAGQTLYIATGQAGSNGQYQGGILDDLRIYNRALSATEILSIYNASLNTVRAGINRGLMGYWSMEDATGTQATDFSGKGNTGALTGSTWVGGKYGSALYFPNTSNYVLVPDNDSLDFGTGDMTVALWAKTTGFVNNGSTINGLIGKGNIASAPAWGISMRTGEDINVWVNAFETNGFYTLPVGEWHHIAFNRVGSTGAIRIYIDGVLDTTTTGDTNTVSNSDSLGIGVDPTNGLRQFLGSIDDARVYNRALSDAEIAYLYTTGQSRKKAADNRDLGGLWTFEDATGTKTTDFSRWGNTGTASGSISFVNGRTGKAMYKTTDSFFNVGLGNASSLDITGDKLTLAAWVKFNRVGTAISEYIVSKGDLAASPFTAYYLRKQSSNQIRFNVGGTTLTLTPSIALNNTDWFHIVGTYNGAIMKLFVNGVEQSTTQAKTGNIPSVGLPVLIGAGHQAGAATTGTLPIFGTVDDVRIYNRALTAEEVLKLYQSY